MPAIRRQSALINTLHATTTGCYLILYNQPMEKRLLCDCQTQVTCQN